jgi:hypothetical protein
MSFSDIGIKERQDLERWIIAHPELLGEELLIITSEFDRFDKSNRRLDILALDSEGVLVVIELKLDASRSLADQQAIRYAAFCSTMIMENLVRLFAVFKGVSEEEASQKICEFLELDDLPELNNRPRIILAAGSFNDQELTSCVLWLRNFGIDISCVELTPYQLKDSSQIILVPRIIIPLPEAKDIQIKAERKEVHQVQQAKQKSEYRILWQAVSTAFNNLDTQFKSRGKSSDMYQQVYVGDSRLHYEWILRKRSASLDVALHFESSDKDENLKFLELIQSKRDQIKQGIDFEFKAAPWGKKWAEAGFRLPFEGEFPNPDIAQDAANLMKILIERTWPIIEPHIKE